LLTIASLSCGTHRSNCIGTSGKKGLFGPVDGVGAVDAGV